MADKTDQLKRRSVLKKGTAIATTSTLLGPLSSVVGASTPNNRSADRFDNSLEQALEIGLEEDSEAMIEYMQSKGYPGATRTVESDFTVRNGLSGKTEQSDQVSTQQINDVADGGVKADMAGVYNPDTGNYDISLNINLRFKWGKEYPVLGCVGNRGNESTGDAPKDAAAMAWNRPQIRHWELASTDQISDFAYAQGQYVDTTQEWSPDSIAYRINDKQAYEDWLIPTKGVPCGEYEFFGAGICGVRLSPINSDEYDEYDRDVFGAYTHAYSKTVTQTGVSASVGTGVAIGLSVTPKTKVDQTENTTRADGDTVLKITQAEIQ